MFVILAVALRSQHGSGISRGPAQRSGHTRAVPENGNYQPRSVFISLQVLRKSHPSPVAILAPSDSYAPSARLRVGQPAAVSDVGTYAPPGTFSKERDAYVVSLGSSATVVPLAGT